MYLQAQLVESRPGFRTERPPLSETGHLKAVNGHCHRPQHQFLASNNYLFHLIKHWKRSKAGHGASKLILMPQAQHVSWGSSIAAEMPTCQLVLQARVYGGKHVYPAELSSYLSAIDVCGKAQLEPCNVPFLHSKEPHAACCVHQLQQTAKPGSLGSPCLKAHPACHSGPDLKLAPEGHILLVQQQLILRFLQLQWTV